MGRRGGPRSEAGDDAEDEATRPLDVSDTVTLEAARGSSGEAGAGDGAPVWPTWTNEPERRPPGAPTEGPRGELARGEALGRYVILAQLGAGGMGVVYTAYDPELDRKVAIKLLHTRAGGSEGSEGRLRLLREAQALARLAHPNVVAVFDVGTLQDGVFIAMEFVAGRTLKDWLREAPRSQEEILGAFRSAGAGLAAAHAAGIVHRDFKPQNVLVGHDERVRVVDFGLARRTARFDVGRGAALPAPSGADRGAAPPAASKEDGASSERAVDSTPALDVAVTQTGQMLGTPRYMAPEQFGGREVSAATDQFAFCVALYEAVYGERPFEAESVLDLALATQEGKVREAPKGSRVPARVRRALLRGLTVAPERRFPSMQLLLSEIGGEPARARRAWLAAAAAVVALAGGLGVAGRYGLRPPEPLCAGAERKLAGVWDEPRKRAVHDALVSTGQRFTEGTWSRVEPLLDGYARRWVEMHTEACEATRVRGELSERVLDARMACLERRRKELGALSDVLLASPKEAAAQAVQAASALSDLEPCADIEGLSHQALPAGEEARARVDALLYRLSQVKALSSAGHYDAAFVQAAAALTSARELRYRPAEAEALFHVGDLQASLGDPKAAEKTLVEAVTAALAVRDDALLSRAAVSLVGIEGARLRRFEEGHLWADFAKAAIERRGGDDVLSVTLAGHLGALLMQEQRYGEARPELTRSLDLARRTLGPEDPEVSRSLALLGTLAYLEGHYEQARAQHAEALALREGSLGPSHPRVAALLESLGLDEMALGRYGEAREALARALSIREQTLGAEHPDTAAALLSLGRLDRREGRDEEAMALLDRARKVYEKTGEERPAAAEVLSEIGELHLRKGEPRDALAVLERAKVLDQEVGAAALDAAATDLALAKALRATGGDLKRARGLAEGAREVFKGSGRTGELGEAEALLAAMPY